MKINKRQLRRIIREAISGVAAGPNRGSTFLDLTMRAIEASDYRKAASYIMDSFMIDDIFPEDEDALISALSALPSASRSPADVEAVADQWIEGIRKEGQDWEDSEYQRGYQDALDGLPVADNATTAYDDGYETADSELEADQKAAEEILATRMGDYSSSPIRETKTTRVTRRQLRQIIKEAMDVVNHETGEVIDFGDDSLSGMPDTALPDLVKRLGLNMSPSGALSNADFEKLEDETLGKQDRRAAKRKSAQMAADRERLNIDSLLQRLRHWAEDAARDYMGDNPSVDLQDIAYDLADAWEYEFEADEREELMWHFDGDLNDLKIYAAESMG